MSHTSQTEHHSSPPQGVASGAGLLLNYSDHPDGRFDFLAGSAEHVQPCGHDDSSAVGPEPESPNADTSVEVPHRGGRGGGGGADSCASPLSHERIAANVTVGERRPSIDVQLGEFQDLLHRLWRAAIRLSNGEPAPPASSRRGRQAGNPAREHIS